MPPKTSGKSIAGSDALAQKRPEPLDWRHLVHLDAAIVSGIAFTVADTVSIKDRLARAGERVFRKSKVIRGIDERLLPLLRTSVEEFYLISEKPREDFGVITVRKSLKVTLDTAFSLSNPVLGYGVSGGVLPDNGLTSILGHISVLAGKYGFEYVNDCRVLSPKYRYNNFFMLDKKSRIGIVLADKAKHPICPLPPV